MRKAPHAEKNVRKRNNSRSFRNTNFRTLHMTIHKYTQERRGSAGGECLRASLFCHVFSHEVLRCLDAVY